MFPMQPKQAIAIDIALQTHVLQTCPIHNEIFFDDDVDPSSAFALERQFGEPFGKPVDQSTDAPGTAPSLTRPRWVSGG